MCCRSGRERGLRGSSCPRPRHRARVLRVSEGAAAADEIEAQLRRAKATIERYGHALLTPFLSEESAHLARLLGDEEGLRASLPRSPPPLHRDGRCGARGAGGEGAAGARAGVDQCPQGVTRLEAARPRCCVGSMPGPRHRPHAARQGVAPSPPRARRGRRNQYMGSPPGSLASDRRAATIWSREKRGSWTQPYSGSAAFMPS